MEQVEIEILGQVITARYGALSTGQILRTDADFAKHLVDDCSAAKYTAVKVAKEATKEATKEADKEPAKKKK